MKGKIALEEASVLPEDAAKHEWWASLFAVDAAEHTRAIAGVHGSRLKKMQQHGVGFTILSYTAPGVSDIWRPSEAHKKAQRINDYIAEVVKAYPDRYGAFA